MKGIRFDGNEVNCDSEATLAAYESYTPYECDCSGCRNYWLAVDSFFGNAALAFFAQFGIDVRKTAEIYDLGPDAEDPSVIQYGGWFHFIGDIVTAGGFITIQDNLIVRFHDGVALVPPSFDGHSLVQVEIEAKIPWLLAEPWGWDKKTVMT